MVFQCDACKQVYELNRRDVRCIYCGEYRCRPVEKPSEQSETEEEEQ